MDGFFFIDKQVNWTSRDVCNKIGHLFNIKKVGHIGTLDPFATGLLIVSVNNATKAGTFIHESNKEYIATLKLGSKTDTGDNTGNIIKEEEIPILDEDIIKKVLSSFIGEYIQTPPMTSAIKVKGVKLYELAHQGIEIERKSRICYIKDISFISYINNELTFKVTASKGTYIRVLGEDIAYKLHTVGHLISLRRTKIDNFDIKDALKLDELQENNLYSIYEILSKVLSTYIIKDEDINKIKNGVNLFINSNEEKILIVDKNNNALAVYIKIEDKIYKCLRGLW